MKFKNYYLMEITSDKKYLKQYKGKIDRDIFDKAVALDPTSKSDQKVWKYVDWIIKHKAWDNSNLTDLLTYFDKFKSKIDPSYLNKEKENKITTHHNKN